MLVENSYILSMLKLLLPLMNEFRVIRDAISRQLTQVLLNLTSPNFLIKGIIIGAT